MVLPAPTTRRDFLRGRPLADAVGRAAAELADAGPGESPNSVETIASVSLISATRRAMACQFEVLLPAAMPNAMNAATEVLDEIDRLEEQLTVYSDTSEVSRINLLAAATPVPIEARLFELFETALRLTNETDGAFDVAAGALIKAWGFFRGPKHVPAGDELARVLERVGSRHVVLDRERCTVAFRRPGVEINLGAIGKGFALDRAVELLRRDWNVSAALVQGGRSSVYAIGSSAALHTSEKRVAGLLPESRRAGNGCFAQQNPDRFFSMHDRTGWPIAIANPYRPVEQLATVWLRDAALGTSGATYQFFEAAGRRFGHVLDPRTGWPADGQACVSVIAPTAAQADALSTAFFILGSDAARDYCERHPEFGAVVVSGSSTIEPLEVSLFGRANECAELPASLNSQPSTLNSQF